MLIFLRLFGDFSGDLVAVGSNYSTEGTVYSIGRGKTGSESESYVVFSACSLAICSSSEAIMLVFSLTIFS